MILSRLGGSLYKNKYGINRNELTIEDKNKIFNKGFQCPICGRALIDLEHDGYNGENPNYHEFWCDHCDIEYDITVDYSNQGDEQKERI